jgi:nucleotide-binding universal stress UspA family protein
MARGPVLIAFDGTPAAERAIRDTAALLGRRPAVVAVVWKAGLAFELMEVPTATIGLPPAPIDVRTAAEIDQHNYASARNLARQGAELARELGLEADPLVVAEDPETPIAETIVSLAKERDAQAVVVGPHRHGPLLLGSISRDVVRHAPCPVVVASRNGA